MKFVLNLEKELNISIDFTNQIDDIMDADDSSDDLVTSGSSSSQSFGKIVDMLDWKDNS